MSPTIAGIVFFVILFILIFWGLNIGTALILVSAAGLWYIISGNAAMTKLGVVPFQTVTSYELAVLSLFLLMAHVVFATGMGKDLFNLGFAWLGHQRGGLAQATIAGCAGFAAVSSSSVATAATIGLVALPEMKRYKYDQSLAAGALAAGGTIGILIPPSGIMIIYGILTESSIGRLFMGGLVPGILQAVFYIIIINLLCIWKPNLGPRGPKFSLKEKIASFGKSGELIGLVILVLGGIYLGWFTPTEAGAIGAFGAIIFSLIRKRLTWGKLKLAFVETLKTTGMVYVIVIGAFSFNYFLAVTNIPTILSDTVAGLPLPSMGILVAILMTYIILGCIMDAGAMVVLTIPIFFPLVMDLGYDAIWFGILVTRMMEIGMITPPIGLNVFVIHGIAKDTPLSTIFKGILPFLVADIFHVALLVLVPSIVLFLPGIMIS